MSMNKTWAISSWISFLTSADISPLPTRQRYDLDSTADSREQSQKAPRRSLTTQLKTSSLARFGITKQTSNAQHPTLNAQFSTSELDTCSRILWELSVERWPFSSEIAPSDGTTPRISRQSHPRRQRIQDPTRSC